VTMGVRVAVRVTGTSPTTCPARSGSGGVGAANWKAQPFCVPDRRRMRLAGASGVVTM